MKEPTYIFHKGQGWVPVIQDSWILTPDDIKDPWILIDEKYAPAITRDWTIINHIRQSDMLVGDLILLKTVAKQVIRINGGLGVDLLGVRIPNPEYHGVKPRFDRVGFYQSSYAVALRPPS